LPKFRRRIFSFPKKKKDKFVHSSIQVMKTYKIIFILIPVYLGLLPYLLYRYTPQDFMFGTTMLILMYILIIESYLYRKGMLREIKEREAKELNSIL
jgi:hypothetical protein